MLTVIAFEIWRYFPFAFLFLLARLQAVPDGLEEAARVDGATPTQQFRYILLPQLMPVIALLSVLRFIMTFNKFDDVYPAHRRRLGHRTSSRCGCTTS